ncbi:Putative uroporphyrinogen-III C-methyltransferase [Marinomonas aquimarina]|uniref:Putative uroporphyrinogen-III C-methyltransferase n=1 Tax=Marinomonas aquimarina TaxID=295068 RepID=A0A1A8T196_9GAMM|nr:uroporphyrinogen-III C-methyltransferase [Marinomonas aquimarina]SBS24619.1 Putative uroporphyrinogen-III C-methyltransferase [Marinomonas aquimarina]
MTDKNDKALTDNTENSVDTTSLESAKESASAPTGEAVNTAKVAPESKDSSSGNKTLPAVAILFGVAALGLSGWQFYQNQYASPDNQALTEAQNKVIALEQQVSQLSGTVESNAAAANQLSEMDSILAAAKSQSDELKANTEQALVDLSSKLNKLNNADKDDWLLAEAEYLIRLANQRLLLEKDTKSSLSLLASADNILAGLEDPLMFDTRKAIAQDMQALKSVASFDLEGRYLQLSALYNQVAELPQREPSKQWQEQQDAEPEVPQTSRSALKQLFNEAWQGLKSLVVINYNQKPIKPLLPPAEYQELVTGIQLQLDVAQVALLKAEPAIYEKSLSRVATAVNQHFDTTAQSTIAFMTTLTSLQQVNPNPDVPMPRASLQAMRNLMQNWKSGAPTAPSNNQGEQAL